ncbi:hypothetical protein CEXT_733681 [Caerostris extrusa]|uniref:Uncharacterized protein n=1 Tax=Caerostris extrusa TaxID=172846 RepID=A0AAV4X7J5_CAEEX|nr:hypothetical protein CEXT_733681 [Caerostris extrusa]
MPRTLSLVDINNFQEQAVHQTNYQNISCYHAFYKQLPLTKLINKYGSFLKVERFFTSTAHPHPIISRPGTTSAAKPFLPSAHNLHKQLVPQIVETPISVINCCIHNNFHQTGHQLTIIKNAIVTMARFMQTLSSNQAITKLQLKEAFSPKQPILPLSLDPETTSGANPFLPSAHNPTNNLCLTCGNTDICNHCCIFPEPHKTLILLTITALFSNNPEVNCQTHSELRGTKEEKKNLPFHRDILVNRSHQLTQFSRVKTRYHEDFPSLLRNSPLR